MPSFVSKREPERTMKLFQKRYSRPGEVRHRPSACVDWFYTEEDARIIQQLEDRYGPTNDLELWGRASRAVTTGAVQRRVEFFNLIPIHSFQKLVGRRDYLDHTYSNTTRLPWRNSALRQAQKDLPPSPESLPLGYVTAVDTDVEPGVVWAKCSLTTQGLSSEHIKWLRENLRTGFLCDLSPTINLDYTPEGAILQHPDHITEPDFSFIDPETGKTIYGAFEELSITSKGDIEGTTIGRVKASNQQAALEIMASQTATDAPMADAAQASGSVAPSATDASAAQATPAQTPATSTSAAPATPANQGAGGAAEQAKNAAVGGAAAMTVEAARKQIEEMTAKAVAAAQDADKAEETRKKQEAAAAEEARKREETQPPRKEDSDLAEPAGKRAKPTEDVQASKYMSLLHDAYTSQLTSALNLDEKAARHLVEGTAPEVIAALIKDAHAARGKMTEAQSRLASVSSAKPIPSWVVPKDVQMKPAPKEPARQNAAAAAAPQQQQSQPKQVSYASSGSATTNAAAPAMPRAKEGKISGGGTGSARDQILQKISETGRSHSGSLLGIPGIVEPILQSILTPPS